MTATIPVGTNARGLVISPDGARVYVANRGVVPADPNAHSVSVISTATNAVTATVPVGNSPVAVAVTPDGARVYVSRQGGLDVAVIDTATNTVIANVPIASASNGGIDITPDGSKAYIAIYGGARLSVISTSTNTVTGSVTVGGGPIAMGEFITPPPGTPPVPPPPGIINPRPRDPLREEVTFVTRCAESIVGVCLRLEIVRACIGRDCYDVPPPQPPICVRCWVGGGLAGGLMLGVLGALVMVRRKHRP